MYSQRARELRRCRFVFPSGRRCNGWALWGDGWGLCSSHAYAGQKRRRWPRGGYPSYPTRYIPCRCGAYAWPHRPGGGLCRWPDEPLERCPIPAGTRVWWRLL